MRLFIIFYINKYKQKFYFDIYKNKKNGALLYKNRR